MDEVIEVGRLAGVEVQLGRQLDTIEWNSRVGLIGTEELLRERRIW